MTNKLSLAVLIVLELSMGAASADPTAAPIAAQPTFRADQFSDFVGLNASPFERYLDSGPFMGAGTEYLPEMFFDLGVRHYRTGLKNDLTLPDAPARISAAYDKYGAQAMVLIDPGKDGAPADIVGRLKQYEPGSVDLIEGPNECNNKFPPQELNLKYKGKTDEAAGAAYMSDLYPAIKADPATSAIGVVSYTAIFTDYHLAKPCSAFDYENMHSYQGSNVPSVSIEPNELDVNNILPLGGLIKPFIPTECGYNVEEDHSNGTNGTGSLRAQALDIPMLLAEYFRHGIKRAYLFAINNADGYGLLENDQTTKRPSYFAFKNFLAAIKDAEWNPATKRWEDGDFTPRALIFSLENAPNTVHTVTLQKKSGEYLLLIWNELPNYNQDTHTEIANPPAPVTLHLQTPVAATATILTQNDAGAYDSTSASVANGDLSLQVSSSVMIVRLMPADHRAAVTLPSPVRLAGTATENSAHISWAPPADGKNIAGYFVYRNSQFLVATKATSYDDTSSWIQPALGYTYGVQAYNSEGDMSAAAPIVVTTPDKRPDFICTGIDLPPAAPGDKIVFKGTIKNIGTGATPQETSAALVFYVDGKYTTYGATDGSPVAPGESRTLTAGLSWAATEGPHVVSVLIDDIDRIPGEISKENNRLDRSFYVGAPTTGSLSAGGDPAPGSVDFSAEGTTDWVIWGRTGRNSVDRKASGNHQIGDMSEVGSGYTDATPSFGMRASWSDGAPTQSCDATYGCLWCNCVGHGYRFDAPADTTERVLRVYAAGIEGAQCTLTAHLSDSSAPDYVSNTFNGNRAFSWAPVPGGFTTAFTIRYKAASAGQKLTVSWVLTGEPNRFLGQARLQGATLAVSRQ